MGEPFGKEFKQIFFSFCTIINSKQIKGVNLKLEIARGKLAREALQDIEIGKKKNPEQK